MISKHTGMDGRSSLLDDVCWSIKVDVHSTFTASTFVWYDVIKNGEGEGEGNQPINKSAGYESEVYTGLGLSEGGESIPNGRSVCVCV